MAVRTILLSLFFVGNLFLVYRTFWGPSGLGEYQELKEEYGLALKEIAKLDSENLALSREIRLLRTDAGYTEKMIRQRLHYLKDNEVLYLFGDETSLAQGNATHE